MRSEQKRLRVSFLGLGALACAWGVLLGCGSSSDGAAGRGSPGKAPERGTPATTPAGEGASRGTAVLTDSSLAETVRKGVVLVDFWSPQCPPCRRQGPIVDGLAKKFAGRATIAKLNVNQNPKAAREFNIMYIPTLIVFKDGKVAKRFTGLKQESDLAAAVEDTLKEK